MRIKLTKDQLMSMSKGLPFEVMVDRPGDARGLLEIIGKSMPWDETGMSKFDNSVRKPTRLTFSVEEAEGSYICDIHPALVQYIYTLLSKN
jgi:hypothetical protein